MIRWGPPRLRLPSSAPLGLGPLGSSLLRKERRSHSSLFLSSQSPHVERRSLSYESPLVATAAPLGVSDIAPLTAPLDILYRRNIIHNPERQYLPEISESHHL
jgi:hypothetical protein